MNIQNVPYIQPPIGHIVKAKLLGLPAFKPIPPATVTVNLVNQSGINVSWLGHKKATYYTVFVYSSSSSSMTSPTLVFTQNLATSGSTISFSPTDGLYYGCSVQVFNANFGANTANISAISTGLLYTAPAEAPTVTAPTSVTLSSLTGTGATVTWSGGSAAISYNVTIYYNSSASVTTSNSQVAQSPFVSVISGSTFTFTASDITYYAATVTVINLDGQATSSISSAVEYFVAPGQPAANTPTNTGTTLNMTWSAPASGGSSITSYTVYVLANGSPASTLTPGLVTSTTFSPMISGTAYSFYVVANGNGGSGTQSTTSAEVTYTAAPVAPTTVTLASLTGTGASVTWSGGSGAASYTVQIYSSASSNMSSPSTVSQTPLSSASVTSPQAFTFTATASRYYGALVTWSGGSGATSYTCQIYYSTASNMASPATISQSPSSSTSVSSGQSFSFSAQDSLYYGAIITAVNAGGSVASSMSTGVQFSGVYAGTPSVGTVVTSASFGRIYAVAVDSAGNTYIADYTGNKIWHIPSGGSASVFAGAGGGGAYLDGAAGSARFNGPSGVAVNAAGTVVYLTDYGNSKIRKITGGNVTTLSGGTHGDWLDGASNVARFYYPSGLALDTTETLLFIGDKLTHRIRVVTIATGAVTTLAGGASSTVGGAGAYADGNGANASFNSPLGVCVDVNNNVYVADQANHRIRKVTYPGGDVTTVAGSGVGGFSNAVGLTARFLNPYGVGMDSYGILYVADKDNKRVRRITGAATVVPSVTSTAVVGTLAGSGVNGNVDNANPLLATFTQLTGVAVGPSRTLYVSQYDNTVANNGLRKITLA